MRLGRADRDEAPFEGGNGKLDAAIFAGESAFSFSAAPEE